MKRHPSLHALALIAAFAQPTGGRSALAAQAADEAPAVVVAAPAPAAASSDGPASSGLRFNFRGAPLEVVLQYLSEAAGFVIVLETPVKGTIEMWSAQPISREEAIPLLNLALNRLGYTATVKALRKK